MRFHKSERLEQALAAALPHATSADDVATLKQCARETSISLVEVQLVSGLLRRAAAAAGAGGGMAGNNETDGGSDGASGSGSHSCGGGGEAMERPLYVHELLLGASPVLPTMATKAPPHPALAPRLDRLRAAQEDREYAKMVGGVVKDEAAAERDAAVMSTYRSQLGVGINLLVSMATMFTVGAYGGGTVEEPFGVRAVICGLLLMLLAMGVEMSLFLIGAIRTDNKVHKRETRARARGVADRTKLSQHLRSWEASQQQGGGAKSKAS